MKAFLAIVLAALSFGVYAEENIPLAYVGSFSSERFTEEHYYLTEVWLWKTKSEYLGILFIYGGLGGDGPVRPMAVKIDKSTGGQGKDFSFQAASFSFVGHFDAGRIAGNLKNGSDSMDGGNAKTVFLSGTNIETIKNPGALLHSYDEWLQWANRLE